MFFVILSLVPHFFFYLFTPFFHYFCCHAVVKERHSLLITVSFIRVKLVRLGHPARLLPQVLDSALDAQVCEFFNFVRRERIKFLFF